MATTPPSSDRVIAGRYRIVKRLATGGMAEVWLADDLNLSRQVAIKVLKPHLAKDPLVAERFRREAKSAASLSHPNIVAVFDTIDSADRLAVVMQFVPGKSLRQTLDERQVLSAEMVIRIARAVAGALDHAHQKHLVHRDVKPGNIMLTPDGQVLLTDFGIAKVTSESGDDLTRDDVMMGTAKYISPEQVRGKKLDGRADLYSLGLVLYECLAGKVPFAATSDVEMALARLSRDPTPLGRMAPTAAPGLVELIHRLLAREPNDRPASGAAILSALDSVIVSMKRGANTGPVPRGAADTPATAPVRPIRPVPPAATPTHGVDRHGRPARRFQQRIAPSLLVVGGLLLAALIIGGLLWSNFNDDSNAAPGQGSAPGSSIATTIPIGPETIPSESIVSLPEGPLTLANRHVYDPEPGDGEENGAILERAFDGDSVSAWLTACYQSQFLGGKGGVGVVLDVTGNTAGTVEVTFANRPWAVEFYATTSEAIPDSLEAWGPRIGKSFSETEFTASAALGANSARHVLVWITQLAKAESGCSQFPYHAAIGEITVTPS